MIKLIATDLDGTLFYPKSRLHGMPSSNAKVLCRFIDGGGRLVLISGRNGCVYENVRKKLKRPLSLLGCNGSFVWDGKSLVENHPMDNMELVRIYNSFKYNYGIIGWMLFDCKKTIYCLGEENVPDGIYRGIRFVNRLNGFYRENMIWGEKTFMDQLQHGKNYKLMMIFGLGKNGERIASETAIAIRDRSDRFNVASSGSGVEMTDCTCDKGSGLVQYCNQLSIQRDEVFVCGDSGNDLSMFRDFPHTFAMSHASNGFKSQANHVIDRISDLQLYLDDQSLVERDQIRTINFEKGFETD